MSGARHDMKVKKAKPEHALMCPACGSTSLRERDRAKGTKSWICRACGRTTYEPRKSHSAPGSGVIAGRRMGPTLHWGGKGWY